MDPGKGGGGVIVLHNMLIFQSVNPGWGWWERERIIMPYNNYAHSLVNESGG